MAQEQCIARLGGWEGYEVEADRDEERGGQRWCVIHLRPVAGRGRCCSGCGRSVPAIHDLEERRIRDLPVFESPVELLVPRVRVACPSCGPKLEQLTWLDPYARITRRLGESVARLCKVATIRHVARWYGRERRPQSAPNSTGFCTKCGAPSAPGDRFCSKCGSALA